MKQPKPPTKPNKPKEPSEITLKRDYKDLDIKVDDITYYDESATLEVSHFALEKLISEYEKLKTNTNLKNISVRLQEYNCRFEFLEEIPNKNYDKDMASYQKKMVVYKQKLSSYEENMKKYKSDMTEYKKLQADAEYQKALKIVQLREKK
jgi:hypothetical protein